MDHLLLYIDNDQWAFRHVLRCVDGSSQRDRKTRVMQLYNYIQGFLYNATTNSYLKDEITNVIYEPFTYWDETVLRHYEQKLAEGCTC